MFSSGRQRALIIPREHGAWGILLVPLLTGAGVGVLPGGAVQSIVPFSLAAVMLFWLRTPVESWMGTGPVRAQATSEVKLVRTCSFMLAAASIAAMVWLFWEGRNRALLWMGGIAAAALLTQAALKRLGRDARTAAQMIGAAGLTATAPAAYYVAAGHLHGTAWSLWAANLLFAVNQIHFVQIRIHTSHTKSRVERLSIGRGFLIAQVILAALLTIACALHLFSWYAAAAFLPILVRGFAWLVSEPRPLAIHALGKSELVHACAFGGLLVLGIGLR